MNAIKVPVATLLITVKENREKHRQIFLEAQRGYREAAIKELDAMLAEARDGKKIRRSITLIEPMDQTRDYDRVIRMLDMTSDLDIMLEEHDFRAYVMDEWTWKAQFNSANIGYSKTLSDTIGASS